MNTLMPLISVVIPAYNHETYVEEAIRSVMEQDYSPVELIVIDDGSKDSSWGVINSLKDECEKRFVRTVFQTQENAGTCITLNRLFNMVEGDFVYLLASDDAMKPHALSRLHGFLAEHPDYVLAVGDNEIIDSESRRAFWDRDKKVVYEESEAAYLTFADMLQKETKIAFGSDAFGSYSSLYRTNHIPNGYLIRRSILSNIPPFTKEAPLEDWYLMLQLAKHGKMKFLPEIIFSYRWHATNTVKQTERMILFTEKTKAYEDKLLLSLPVSSMTEEVQEVCQIGAVYKNGSIKPFFEWKKRMGPKGRVLELIFFSMFKASLKRN
ncbi:MAG: glycosyltransferase family 2 protein [Desulfovibrio sp.]|nr:glycosyltransferase family 2 protein [Desulfovibrio sp.]